MGKKNIIFYFSDQQRWDTVNEEVTPNLCALAKEGIKYENNFTCQPVCGPARACLQTGVYATQCGCYWNGIPLPSDIKPLAHYFNEAGYQTAYIGKWHLASNRLPGVGLHCESTAIPREKQGEYQYFRGADVLEFTSHGYDGYIFDESGNKLDFKGYRADCINDYALEFLDKRDKDKPFFMFVSQLEPHHQNDHHTYEGYKPTVEKYKDYPLPDDLTFLKGNYKEMYPDYAVVAYINTTADLKTICDVCVTSSSAVKIVSNMPEKNILFIPDCNLGDYVSRQLPDKNFKLLHGGCPIHACVTAEDVKKAKAQFPNAELLVHPECQPAVVDLADYVGSTSGIMNYAKNSDKKEFIIGTEISIAEHLQYDCPDKKFHILTQKLICPNMKATTLMDVFNCLKGEGGEEIILDEQTITDAKKCIDEMIRLGG